MTLCLCSALIRRRTTAVRMKCVRVFCIVYKLQPLILVLLCSCVPVFFPSSPHPNTHARARTYPRTFNAANISQLHMHVLVLLRHKYIYNYDSGISMLVYYDPCCLPSTSFQKQQQTFALALPLDRRLSVASCLACAVWQRPTIEGDHATQWIRVHPYKWEFEAKD